MRTTKLMWNVGAGVFALGFGMNGVLPAQGCMAIDSRGKPIRITSENALIVWDEKTHTEHFLRQATFDAKARDFGFLVPTPTVPKLTEADPQIFARLQEWTAPHELQFNYEFATSENSAQVKTKSASSVEIVATAEVGGYNAVVLKATDTTALQRWLSARHYLSSPALIEWIAPYVKKGWAITAFKLSKRNKRAATMTSSAVSLSFQTNSPIYPYREPLTEKTIATPDAANGSRPLEVYFCATEAYRGTLETTGANWDAETVTSKPLDAQQTGELLWAIKAPSDLFGSGAYLTRMKTWNEDRKSRSDLVFVPAKVTLTSAITDLKDSEKFPVEKRAAVGSVTLLGMGGLWFGLRLRRNRFVREK